jgi:hypothetical protein
MPQSQSVTCFKPSRQKRPRNYPENLGPELSSGAHKCTLFDYSLDMCTGNLSSGALRWIADIAVMGAFQSRVLDLPDFYFTGDDYRYRFEPEVKQRFLGLLRERFNSGVRYKERSLKWDTVIEQKTVELGRYLAGRTSRLDFSEPSPGLRMRDDKYLRRRILGLSQGEAQRLGIGKSTLHFLRESARNERSFKVYSRVHAKLLEH